MTLGDKASRAGRNLRGHMATTTFPVIHPQEDMTNEGSDLNSGGVTPFSPHEAGTHCLVFERPSPEHERYSCSSSTPSQFPK